MTAFLASSTVSLALLAVSLALSTVDVYKRQVPYGTTLTVKATGKNAQCVLTALTANGEDILATQRFVVKGATEVKATFVDHTGVETTVTQQVRLYPNPATGYVIVDVYKRQS